MLGSVVGWLGWVLGIGLGGLGGWAVGGWVVELGVGRLGGLGGLGVGLGCLGVGLGGLGVGCWVGFCVGVVVCDGVLGCWVIVLREHGTTSPGEGPRQRRRERRDGH